MKTELTYPSIWQTLGRTLRPPTEGWYRKMPGEGQPAMLGPQEVVDVVSGMRILHAGLAAENINWDLIHWWRMHHPDPTARVDQMAAAVGLTKKDPPYARRLRREIEILERGLESSLSLTRAGREELIPSVLKTTREDLDKFRGSRQEKENDESVD